MFVVQTFCLLYLCWQLYSIAPRGGRLGFGCGVSPCLFEIEIVVRRTAELAKAAPRQVAEVGAAMSDFRQVAIAKYIGYDPWLRLPHPACAGRLGVAGHNAPNLDAVFGTVAASSLSMICVPPSARWMSVLISAGSDRLKSYACPLLRKRNGVSAGDVCSISMPSRGWTTDRARTLSRHQQEMCRALFSVPVA